MRQEQIDPKIEQIEDISDKKFWMRQLTQQGVMNVMKHYEKIPESVKQNRDFWLACAEKDIWTVLNNYEKIPEGIFNQEEIEGHWLAGAEKDIWVVLDNYEKIPKSVKQDRDFWLAGLENDFQVVLNNYEKIPEGIFNQEEIEDHWLAGAKKYIWTVLYNYEKIPESVKQKLLENSLVFNEFLEASEAEIQIITKFFETKAVALNKAKHLYVIRMFALHPNHYQELKQTLQEQGIDISLFEEYQQEVDELKFSLNQIGLDKSGKQEEINPSEISFAIEIESQNLHNLLEIDTTITNNYQKIIHFIEKLDEFHKDIRKEIKSVEGSVAPPGLYDNVHINIGIPDNTLQELENIKQALEERKSELYSILELTGFLYNTIGRTKYIFKTHYNDLICIDQAKQGYENKLQDRYWSLNFHKNNAPLFKIIFGYLAMIIKLYHQDFKQAESCLKQDLADIMVAIKEEVSPDWFQNKLKNDYYDFIDADRCIVNKNKIEKFDEPESAYLPKRGKILSEIMKILGKKMQA